MSSEYAVTKEDVSGNGGGGNSAKPRGKYTGAISKAISKKDKNGKFYLGFGISITKGKYKKGLIFENYLSLDPKANKYSIARRNSFYTAITLEAGQIPYGVPEGPKVEALNGTIVDVTIEHRFEDVPGEQYDIVTSRSKKMAWHTDGWDDCLDDKGRLFKNSQGEVFDEPIAPREEVTFYALSDDFEGVGGAVDEAPAEDDSADDDSWG